MSGWPIGCEEKEFLFLELFEDLKLGDLWGFDTDCFNVWFRIRRDLL